MQVLRLIYIRFLIVITCIASCNTSDSTDLDNNANLEGEITNEENGDAIIDLRNWKVTLPIGNPTEVEPPQILDFQNIDILKPYMYEDTEDQSIVFYTEPGSTTTNSSYSRTELREQMEPGSNNTNWTFEEGGTLTGKLKVNKVSGEEGKLDRIIVMQIHGRLTNDQRDLIDKTDNNAPPVLKIYWDDGKINVRRKILKDIDVSDIDILKKESWTDESHWFETVVDYNPFKLSIEVKGTTMKIKLSEEETFTFDDIHTSKWSVFENYFKAGNYLQTAKSGSFAEVKYYELEVNH